LSELLLSNVIIIHDAFYFSTPCDTNFHTSLFYFNCILFYHYCVLVNTCTNVALYMYGWLRLTAINLIKNTMMMMMMMMTMHCCSFRF